MHATISEFLSSAPSILVITIRPDDDLNAVPEEWAGCADPGYIRYIHGAGASPGPRPGPGPPPRTVPSLSPVHNISVRPTTSSPPIPIHKHNVRRRSHLVQAQHGRLDPRRRTRDVEVGARQGRCCVSTPCLFIPLPSALSALRCVRAVSLPRIHNTGSIPQRTCSIMASGPARIEGGIMASLPGTLVVISDPADKQEQVADVKGLARSQEWLQVT